MSLEDETITMTGLFEGEGHRRASVGQSQRVKDNLRNLRRKEGRREGKR